MLAIHVILKHLLAGAVFSSWYHGNQVTQAKAWAGTVRQKVFPPHCQLSFPGSAADQVGAVALATDTRTPDAASGSSFM